jgi:hypothetical protein
MPEEEALLRNVEKPISLNDLRAKLGPDWERRAQPLFGLIAAGLVKATMPKDVTLEAPADEKSDGFGKTLRTISVALPLPAKKEAPPVPTLMDRLKGALKR